MELTFQAATPAERLYTARQSTQISGQTGSIGHLRADMGTGRAFSHGASHTGELDNREFSRSWRASWRPWWEDEQYGGF